MRSKYYISQPTSTDNVIGLVAGTTEVMRVSKLSGDDQVLVSGDVAFVDGACLSRENPNVKGCTVDGVDVSELENRVITLEAKDSIPTSTAFAAGNVSGAGSGSCSGLNISGSSGFNKDITCNFTTAAPNSNYIIVATPLGPSGCLGSLTVQIRNRSISGFLVHADCDTNSTFALNATFVAFLTP